jgi:hypothetical protein
VAFLVLSLAVLGIVHLLLVTFSKLLSHLTWRYLVITPLGLVLGALLSLVPVAVTDRTDLIWVSASTTIGWVCIFVIAGLVRAANAGEFRSSSE